MIRRPPRSTLDRSSAASDVYKRQLEALGGRDVRECAVGKFVIQDDARGRIVPGPVERACIGVVEETQSHLRRRTRCCSCLLYTSPSPRDRTRSRMPSSAWKKQTNNKKKKQQNNTKKKKKKIYLNRTYQPRTHRTNTASDTIKWLKQNILHTARSRTLHIHVVE